MIGTPAMMASAPPTSSTSPATRSRSAIPRFFRKPRSSRTSYVRLSPSASAATPPDAAHSVSSRPMPSVPASGRLVISRTTPRSRPAACGGTCPWICVMIQSNARSPPRSPVSAKRGFRLRRPPLDRGERLLWRHGAGVALERVRVGVEQRRRRGDLAAGDDLPELERVDDRLAAAVVVEYDVDELGRPVARDLPRARRPRPQLGGLVEVVVARLAGVLAPPVAVVPAVHAHVADACGAARRGRDGLAEQRLVDVDEADAALAQPRVELRLVPARVPHLDDQRVLAERA